MTLKFYDKIPEMECLQGDTLPGFFITVDTDDLTDCTMKMVLSSWNTPEEIVKQKPCTISDDGFTVQLTSKDTADLSGIYHLCFCMTDSGGLHYRKLYGILHVIPAFQEE